MRRMVLDKYVRIGVAAVVIAAVVLVSAIVFAEKPKEEGESIFIDIEEPAAVTSEGITG